MLCLDNGTKAPVRINHSMNKTNDERSFSRLEPPPLAWWSKVYLKVVATYSM